MSGLGDTRGIDGAADITQLLREASQGDADAGHSLYDSVYRELRAIAGAHRRRWSGNDTLNTTALISEAYLRLANSDLASYRDRTHFFSTASRAMRQVLINYAERIAAAKRGGDWMRVTLSGVALESDKTFEELLQIDRFLRQLEASNPRHCRVFECRVFGGMSTDETAEAIGASAATVKRDWAVVSAWLYSRMSEDGAGNDNSDAQ